MRLRNSSIRARTFILVVIPLLSLVGLYAFATTITARDAITLARSTAVRNTIADPIGLFEAQVQTERMLATVYLASPVSQNLAAFNAQVPKTNSGLSALRAAVNTSSTRRASSPQVKAALAAAVRDATGLAQVRVQVTSRAISRAQAQNDYSTVVAAGFNAIIQAVMQMPNVPQVTQALAVMRITQGEDILLQEQALLVGDLTARSFPAADHARFAQLVGEHRGLVTEAMQHLAPVYLTNYRQYASPRADAALTALENAVINSRPGVLPRVPLAAYQQAAGTVAVGLALAGFKSGITLAAWGREAARPIDLQLILAGGLGMLAILVSVLLSVWIGRGTVRQLAGLRRTALELADERLPQVVARLSAGETVDVDAEMPLMEFSRDEIGQVGHALNSVQRTAIEAAVGQARLRAGVSTVFRNLARRSQSLLHRQLALLDALELTAGPEELASLFRIDHLTTRMRRQAEGLVVLAGEAPGRGWSNAVPLVDVLRAAMAEVEDYTRIRVVTTSRSALAGPAVADVIHVIAELAENATIYSPRSNSVRIFGEEVARGFAVEIEDRGLGMSRDLMTRLNAMLADPPQLDLAASDQLGLYVAARLAKRQGIRVTLRGSPFGGTSAIVLIPQNLVVSEETYAKDPAASLANEKAVQLTGRHAARGAVTDLSPVGSPAGHNGSANGGNANGDSPGQGNGHGNGHGNATLATAPDRGQVPRGFFSPDTGDAAGQLAKGAAAEGTARLPQRIRQANLAPQLRDAPAGGTADANGGTHDARPPSEARDTMASIQRGWERGRAESATADRPGFETNSDHAPGAAGPTVNGPEHGRSDDGGTPDLGT